MSDAELSPPVLGRTPGTPRKGFPRWAKIVLPVVGVWFVGGYVITSEEHVFDLSSGLAPDAHSRLEMIK